MGRLTKSTGIEFASGERIREIGEEGHRYLGAMELDKIMKDKMNNVSPKILQDRATCYAIKTGRNQSEATIT